MAGAVVLPSTGMAPRQALVAVSAVQLAAGVAGQVIALRRRHPYDTPLMGGRPEHVGRDSFLSGTALSAPVVMLVAQAWTGPSNGSAAAIVCSGVPSAGHFSGSTTRSAPAFAASARWYASTRCLGVSRSKPRAGYAAMVTSPTLPSTAA